MITDRRNGEKRGDNGRFLPGNPGGPGRKRGASNQATVIAKELKLAIVAHAMETVRDKPRIVTLLDELASDAAAYIRQVCSILPRDLEVENKHEYTIAALVSRVSAEADAYEADLLKRFGKLPPEGI